jgi:hypothetical protein
MIAMKISIRLAIPVILSTFLALSARAQNAGLSQEKGTISGTVIDAVSEQPLKGAEVRLRGLPSATGTAQQSTSRSTSASSDASGRFVFEGLSPGRYLLLVSLDGYINDYHANPMLRGELLSLAAGQHINDVVLRLLPYGSIAGHMTNEAGKPIRGVSVQAMKSSYLRGMRDLHDAAHAVTSEAGEYRITGLAPGKYYIRAKPLASLKPKPGSDKTYVPLYYPAANDRVRAVALVLRAGEDLAGIDLNLVPVHTVHIRGRVINARTSLPSSEAEVTLLSDQGEMIFASKDFSAAQATFEFQGVLPGSYVLVAQQPSNPRERKTMWGRTSIEVGDTNLEHADVVVGPGVDVSGRIRVEGKTPVDLGEKGSRHGMTGILVSQEASALAGLVPDIDIATVNADGTFIFREVPEGSYRINFGQAPAGFYLKSSGAADVLETGITVGRGHSPPALELVLSPGAGRVDGSVESGDQSVPGALVVLVPDGKQRAQPNYYRQALSDQLGRFAMRNIVPGDYMLFAWEQIDRDAYYDPEFLGQYEDRGKALHIEESGQATVKLEVIPAADTLP